MGTIDNIVTVNIAATQATPSLPGTDVIGIIGYHTAWTDLIRTYFNASDMLTDGFDNDDPLYLMALSMCSQSPRPSIFKVIRGTTSVQQVVHFKVTDSQNGHVVGLVLTDAEGATHAVQHTNSGSQSLASIATALAAISVTGATLAVNGGDNTQVDITITQSGDIWYPSGIFGGNFTDTTASASPSVDLAAAALVDPNFYGVSGAWLSPANITDIAAWTEANNRLHAYTTADTNNLSASSGVFNTLKTSAYNRTYGQFSGTPISYGATALMAQRFTDDPGSDTWAYKTLAGVASDNLTPTQIANAVSIGGAASNNGNVYVPVANINVTLTGQSASGLFTDLQRGADALARDIQLGIFTMLAQTKKIPYTRKGISMVAGVVRNSLQSFVVSGYLSGDSGLEPVVSVPDIATVSTSDKSKRILRNVKFTATAQGAAQTIIISGNVSF